MNDMVLVIDICKLCSNRILPGLLQIVFLHINMIQSNQQVEMYSSLQNVLRAPKPSVFEYIQLLQQSK